MDFEYTYSSWTNRTGSWSVICKLMKLEQMHTRICSAVPINVRIESWTYSMYCTMRIAITKFKFKEIEFQTLLKPVIIMNVYSSLNALSPKDLWE